MISSLFFLSASLITILSIIIYRISGVAPSLLLVWIGVSFMPVFFTILRHIQWEHKPVIHDNIYTILLYISLLAGTIFFFHTDILVLILLIFTVSILVFSLDERILFAFALCFLLATISCLIMDKVDAAEKLAQHVYSSLSLGVVVSIVEPYTLSLMKKYLPKKSLPTWWSAYIWELLVLVSLMRQILPLIISSLILWSVSPWGYMVSFDTQFIGALVIIFFLSFFVSSPDDVSLTKYLSPLMACICILLMWYIFPVVWWWRWVYAILLIALFAIMIYRGEYVKHLAKKYISL